MTVFTLNLLLCVRKVGNVMSSVWASDEDEDDDEDEDFEDDDEWDD